MIVLVCYEHRNEQSLRNVKDLKRIEKRKERRKERRSEEK